MTKELSGRWTQEQAARARQRRDGIDIVSASARLRELSLIDEWLARASAEAFVKRDKAAAKAAIDHARMHLDTYEYLILRAADPPITG